MLLRQVIQFLSQFQHIYDSLLTVHDTRVLAAISVNFARMCLDGRLGNRAFVTSMQKYDDVTTFTSPYTLSYP